MGRVGIGGFEILWLEPNLTRYQKNFCNPTQPTTLQKPTQLNKLGQVGLVLAS